MARKKKSAKLVVDEPIQSSQEASEIGMVSESTEATGSGSKASKSKLAGLFSEFSIYDALLLTSLVCITLATLRVFFAMHQYGGYFWTKPWNP